MIERGFTFFFHSSYFICLPHLYVRMEAWFFALFHLASNLPIIPPLPSPSFLSLLQSILSRIFIFPRVCLIRAVIIQPSQFPATTREQMKIFAREICRFDCWISSSVFLFRVRSGSVTPAIYFWRKILHAFEKVKWMDKILLRTLMEKKGKGKKRQTFHLYI